MPEAAAPADLFQRRHLGLALIETSHELEKNVTAPKKDTLGGRERRLDDAALAKGFVVSKTHSVKQIGRYIIVGHPVKMIRSSPNPAFPYSFSIEEAESYLARQSDLIVVNHSHDTPITA